MKKLFALLALLIAIPVFAAQAIQIDWTLPTQAVDGSALTGNQALTKVQVWVASATIPLTTSAVPTVELGPGVTSTSQTITIPAGGAAFVRLKACNAGGCSAFTNEVSVPVPVAVPGLPTTVTIKIVVAP